MASDRSTLEDVLAAAAGTVRLCGWTSLGAWVFVFVFVLSSVDLEAFWQTDLPTENSICLQAIELAQKMIPRTVVVYARSWRTAKLFLRDYLGHELRELTKSRPKIIRMNKEVTEENNKQNEICGFRDEVHDLTNNSFIFDIPRGFTVYAYKLNLFAPIRRARLFSLHFLDTTNPQWHCVQISWTEFHPDRAINVQRRDWIILPLLNGFPCNNFNEAHSH
jgi:hypothetical protein